MKTLCESNLKLFSDSTYRCPYADGYNEYGRLDQKTKNDIKYFVTMNQLGFYTTNSQNGHKDAEYKDCSYTDVIKHRKFVPNFSMQRAYVSGLIEKSKLPLFEKTFTFPTMDVPDNLPTTDFITKNNLENKDNLENMDNLEKTHFVMMYSDGTCTCPRATLTCDLRIENDEIKNIFQFTKCQYLDSQFKYIMVNCEMYDIEPKDCVYIEFIDLRWGQKDELFKEIISCLKQDLTRSNEDPA